MGTRKVEQGVVGEQVARNVRRLREGRGLSLQNLSDRLAGQGRPILPSGLSKIESGDRRVDVDDLVALANALETVPSALLQPKEALDTATAEQQFSGHRGILKTATRAIRACEAKGISRYDVVEWLNGADTVHRMAREFWRRMGMTAPDGDLDDLLVWSATKSFRVTGKDTD